MYPKRQLIQQQSFQSKKQYINISFNQNSAKFSNKKKKKSVYPYILCLLLITKIRKSIKRHRHRDRILEQWLNTQRSYNFDLSIAIQFIKGPMVSMKNINFEKIQVLFPEVEAMIKLSNRMISVLENAISAKNQYTTHLGRDINQFVDQYKIYGNYFATHAHRLQILNNLLQTSQQELKQIEFNMQGEYARRNSKKQGMTIKDVMDQPHNRLFKYVILLKQYIKKLQKYHKDYDHSTKSLALFHETNNYNNDLIKKLEEKEKKRRLYDIFGEKMLFSGSYITEVQAKTLYNDVKIYIFQRLIAVTLILEKLGSQKQESLCAFQISQLFFVTGQNNIKYFKNIALLIGSQTCIHFFFAEPEIKAEFIKTIQQQIRQSRNSRYRQGKSQKIIGNAPSLAKKTSEGSSSGSGSGSFREIKYTPIQPQFRIQVLGFDVRPFGTLSNNTQYIIRLMIPFYFGDQIAFFDNSEINIKKQMSLNKPQRSSTNSTNPSTDSQKGMKVPKVFCLNQRIQMNYNMIEELCIHMQALCSAKLPEIDPVLRDINSSSSKGKRKTMSYEVRKFLVQQFFNTAFRSPSVLATSTWYLSKMRINEQMWSYAINRNAYLKQNLGVQVNQFDQTHCNYCKSGDIRSIEQFQKTRKKSTQSQGYCFNFLNLLKHRLLSLNLNNFDTLQRILTYYHYMQGRFDYQLMNRRKEKNMKMIKIYLASVENNYIQITIDSKTTVGEGLEEIGKMLQIDFVFDFDILMVYEGRTRVLDRDQFLADLVKEMGIVYEQYSCKNNVIKKKTTLMATLREWSTHLLQPSNPENKLLFLKTTYLTKSLQIKSLMQYPQKLELEIQKIFWVFHNGTIKLPTNQLIQKLALIYCFKIYDNLYNSDMSKVSWKMVEIIMPDYFTHHYHYDQDLKRDIAAAIERQKNIIKANRYTKNHLSHQLINFAYERTAFRTFFIEAEPKQIPVDLIEITQIPQKCLLGVNLKNLIVCQHQSDSNAILLLPLSQIECQVTVFSIYIFYENETLRFDGKMLFQFGEIIKKYQTLLTKFPHLLC